MRVILIGLSFIFFALSAIITIKAMGLPVYKTTFQENRKDLTSEPDVTTQSTDVIKKLTEDQDTNRALVADLQATIARLEDKLTTKEESIENIKTADAKNMSQTLTVFGGGTFRPGQDVINDISFSIIENLIKEISASPGSQLIIEGHTDNTPIKSSAFKQYKDNMDLSFLRAKAIANILAFHGVSLERISVTGYGDTRPIDSNDTKEGRAKNRRVEVKLMPKEREM